MPKIQIHGYVEEFWIEEQGFDDVCNPESAIGG